MCEKISQAPTDSPLHRGNPTAENHMIWAARGRQTGSFTFVRQFWVTKLKLDDREAPIPRRMGEKENHD
ncbi:hypothetical protein TNCV_1717321 [Trichonephila clavipes]|nr:hypothetical protein TNCV_1717321 [Trichonephila clavipes]